MSGDDVGDKLSHGGLEVYVREIAGAARGGDKAVAIQIGQPGLGHGDPAVAGNDLLAEDVERGVAHRGAVRCHLVGLACEVMTISVTAVLATRARSPP